MICTMCRDEMCGSCAYHRRIRICTTCHFEIIERFSGDLRVTSGTYMYSAREDAERPGVLFEDELGEAPAIADVMTYDAYIRAWHIRNPVPA